VAEKRTVDIILLLRLQVLACYRQSSAHFENDLAQTPKKHRKEDMWHEQPDDQLRADSKSEETPSNDRKEH